MIAGLLFLIPRVAVPGPTILLESLTDYARVCAERRARSRAKTRDGKVRVLRKSLEERARLSEARGDLAGYLGANFLDFQIDRLEVENDWLDPMTVRRYRQQVFEGLLGQSDNIRQSYRTLLDHPASNPQAVRFVIGGDSTDRYLLLAMPDGPDRPPRYVLYTPDIPCSDAAFCDLKTVTPTRSVVYEISDPSKSLGRFEARVRGLDPGYPLVYTQTIDTPTDYLFWAADHSFNNDHLIFGIPENLLKSAQPPVPLSPELLALRSSPKANQRIKYIDEITTQKEQFLNPDPEVERTLTAWLKEKAITPKLAEKILNYLGDWGKETTNRISQMDPQVRRDLLAYWANQPDAGNRFSRNLSLYVEVAGENENDVILIANSISIEQKLRLLGRESHVSDSLNKILAVPIPETERESRFHQMKLLNFLQVIANMKGEGTVAVKARNFLTQGSREPFLPTSLKYMASMDKTRLLQMMNQYNVR